MSEDGVLSSRGMSTQAAGGKRATRRLTALMTMRPAWSVIYAVRWTGNGEITHLLSRPHLLCAHGVLVIHRYQLPVAVQHTPYTARPMVSLNCQMPQDELITARRVDQGAMTRRPLTGRRPRHGL